MLTTLLTRQLPVGGLLLLVMACATVRRGERLQADSDYCAPARLYPYETAYMAEPAKQAELLADTNLTRRFSQHDLLLAHAVGILPQLQKLINAGRNTTTERRLEAIELRQKITSRLLLVSTEVASLAAELDCEGERADQLATYLDQKDTRRIRRLTVASVVVGAVTTVVTAFGGSGNSGKVAGIGGGLVSGGLAGLAAFSSNRTVRFTHKRNLLADIWQQSRQSAMYSPFVWYVLNEKLFSNSGQHSISYNTRQRWQGYVLTGLSSEKEQLFFGAGGDYQADDLHIRSNMINQVQSSVRSISQDLQSLMLNLPE